MKYERAYFGDTGTQYGGPDESWRYLLTPDALIRPGDGTRAVLVEAARMEFELRGIGVESIEALVEYGGALRIESDIVVAILVAVGREYRQ